MSSIPVTISAVSAAASVLTNVCSILNAFDSPRWLTYLETVKKVEDICCQNPFCKPASCDFNITLPFSDKCSDAITAMIDASPIPTSPLSYYRDKPLWSLCTSVYQKEDWILELISHQVGRQQSWAIATAVTTFVLAGSVAWWACSCWQPCKRDYTPVESGTASS